MTLSNPFPTPSASVAPLESDRVWASLRAQVGRGESDGGLVQFGSEYERGWAASGGLTDAARYLLDLYAPLCAAGPESPFVVGHLGQSIDGYIAGAEGDSRHLSSQENIVHLHRLRALFDVILVGRKTVATDDPKLTTRLVPGMNPVRVVLDPALRCSRDATLFGDGLTETIIVCAADAPRRDFGSATKVLRLDVERCKLTFHAVLARLIAEGLPRVFVEGGGVTVSRAVHQAALDRLHLTVAPVLIGNGYRGIQLQGVDCFQDALRPRSARFSMGTDVLFDFELGAGNGQ